MEIAAKPPIRQLFTKPAKYIKEYRAYRHSRNERWAFIRAMKGFQRAAEKEYELGNSYRPSTSLGHQEDVVLRRARKIVERYSNLTDGEIASMRSAFDNDVYAKRKMSYDILLSSFGFIVAGAGLVKMGAPKAGVAVGGAGFALFGVAVAREARFYATIGTDVPASDEIIRLLNRAYARAETNEKTGKMDGHGSRETGAYDGRKLGQWAIPD